MKEVLAFLKNCGTFYIATTEGDQPRVRPFGAVCEFENKLYIIMNNTKNVYKQIMKNPKIEISGMFQGKWIRLQAEAFHDPRREAKVAMLNDYTELLGRMYNPDDNLMEVFYLKNAKASINSYTEKPEEYSF